MTMREVADAMIESERVERRLAALGYDRLAIHGIQQEIADLFQTTTMTWTEATDTVLQRVPPAHKGATKGATPVGAEADERE